MLYILLNSDYQARNVTINGTIRGDRINRDWQCQGNETNLLLCESGSTPNSCVHSNTRAAVNCTGELRIINIIIVLINYRINHPLPLPKL